MTTIAPATTHSAEFLRFIDAKDETGIFELLADDAQIVDDTTRQWIRGRTEIGEALREALSHEADIQSRIEGRHVERWGDVEVETFVLHEVFDLDGDTCRTVAPTTLIWRRGEHGWRLALWHSVPTSCR
jgi:ketosteroid isomerase-like protein